MSWDYVYHLAIISFRSSSMHVINISSHGAKPNNPCPNPQPRYIHVFESNNLFPPTINTDNLSSGIRRSITEQENNRLSNLLARPDTRNSNWRNSNSTLNFRRPLQQRCLNRTTNTAQLANAVIKKTTKHINTHGATALTLISGPTSFETDLVNPETACFVVE